MLIPVRQIRPNPNQPRKRFCPAALAELAASIVDSGGLLQPITVRPERGASGAESGAPGAEGGVAGAEGGAEPTYLIVAGERRWRAHVLAGLEFIEANVKSLDDEQRDVAAIVENLQRVDVTPLEEARAFKRMLDEHGYTVETLAKKLGVKQPFRIADRIQLLRLRDDILPLLERGHLTPAQAFEISRLSAGSQSALLAMIRDGKCSSYARLRAAADALLQAESQAGMFEEAEPPTAAQRAALSRFERLIERLVAACNEGISDNEVVVLKRVDPMRAETVLAQLALIRGDLAKIETALQQAVAVGALRKAA